MTNISVPVEVMTVFILLAQTVQYLVMRRGKRPDSDCPIENSSTDLDHKKIISNGNTIIEGQKEMVSVLNEMSNNSWRTAQLLKDIKDDLKEFMRTYQK